MLPKQVNKHNVKSFLDSFDNILTDCDGVLWCGDNVIPGANTALNKLRALGKRVFFVTNNSTKSRDTVASKALTLGFEANKEEAISSSYVLAEHLKQISFDGKVYVIGTDGIAKELEQAGIPFEGVGAAEVPSNWYDLSTSLKLDKEVKAVVVGYDPFFNIAKLTKAASYLANPSCMFFSTNQDIMLPAAKGDIHFPGTGSLVKCVETGSGRLAEDMGKPHPRMFNVLAEKYNLDPKRTLMVGDNCATDILLGKNCGLITLFVLTGVHTMDHQIQWSQSENLEDRKKLADFYIPSLGDIVNLLEL